MRCGGSSSCPTRRRHGSRRSTHRGSAGGNGWEPSSPTTTSTTESRSTCGPTSRRGRATPGRAYLRLDGPNQWLDEDDDARVPCAGRAIPARDGRDRRRADGGHVFRAGPCARPPAHGVRRTPLLAGEADPLSRHATRRCRGQPAPRRRIPHSAVAARGARAAGDQPGRRVDRRAAVTPARSS